MALEGHEPVPDLPIGSEVRATGTLAHPRPWEADYLARFGIREVLRARAIEPTGKRRGGLPGAVDGVRGRAAAALESGTPDAEAALLRGFLLGEDDRIDPATVDDFKRAGLAHLLAVSGDCVMLLALLGAWLLGMAGVPLRARLVALLALIAVYVPVAGGGPSIQRAGIMGAAGVVAALAGRPRWRWYALLLAATLTLLLNPRSVADPSWQLSFAAVTGILVFAAPIRDLILGTSDRNDSREPPSAARRALAEGAGVTIAATLATAPLFAHHFGAVSLASLPANLLALPAIAPMMWLGMLAAILGQVPGAPVEPFTALAGLLAAYVAQVAGWLAAPGWAQLGMELPAWPQVGAAYVALVVAMSVAGAWARRRRGTAAHATAMSPGRRRDRRGGGLCGARRSGRRPVRRSRSRACGSWCSTSARGTRSCSTRRTAGRCWWTVDRRATTSVASWATRASRTSQRPSSPTIRPTTSAGWTSSCTRGSRFTASSTLSQGPTSFAPHGRATCPRCGSPRARR